MIGILSDLVREAYGMDLLRVSIGTAIVLGLRQGRTLAPPTTAYIMVGDSCSSNCSFCTQARGSTSRSDRLSRVTWPRFERETVVRALSLAKGSGIRRICLQVLVDASALAELPDLVIELARASDLPISLSVPPVGKGMMRRLMEAGADRMGIAIDAPSDRTFDLVKGADRGNPYTYEGHWGSLSEAVEVFGRGKVSTHIIIGMMETDEEVFDAMVRARDLGVIVSLFAYMPAGGTEIVGAPPSLGRYRTMQVLRYLLFEAPDPPPRPEFDDHGRIVSLDLAVLDHIRSGTIFATRGCPDCNRPYYTERPLGVIYNHPSDPGPETLREGLEEAVRYVQGR